jgi:hypothetical protein
MKTNTAANALLKNEASQEISAMVAMTDSGDHKTFSTVANLWSGKSGYEPKIYPDGLETGGVISPGVAADKVSVAALSCYLAGVKPGSGEGGIVPADAAVSVTRPASSPAGLKKISSVTINSVGAIAVVAGTDGAVFVATRGAAGGPPLIPVGSIEIGQVKLTSSAAALIATTEIFQVPGTSLERYDYPTRTVEDSINGTITFASALPAIHVGSPATYKGVYAEVYEPVFSDLEPVSDFVAPETSYSVSSTPVYGGVVGSESASLGQGSFKYYAKDGLTEPIVALKGQILFFKYFPDRNKTPYYLCQGKLGIKRTWPAGGGIMVDCTISASEEGIEAAS